VKTEHKAQNDRLKVWWMGEY